MQEIGRNHGEELINAETFAGEEFHLVYAMTTTWESIGILVYRGEVSLPLVDDFYSGPVVVSWRKLENFIMAERDEVGRQTINEWFQWLKERLEETESKTPPVPAHIEHRDWTPPKY